MYTITDQCGQRIGSTPRGMILVLRSVDHEYKLSVISVVGKLGTLLVDWYSFFFK